MPVTRSTLGLYLSSEEQYGFSMCAPVHVFMQVHIHMHVHIEARGLQVQSLNHYLPLFLRQV